MSVNDEAALPWLVAEKRFIRAAIEEEKAVVGICLGAQLIGSAMGARVYPNFPEPPRESTLCTGFSSLAGTLQ